MRKHLVLLGAGLAASVAVVGPAWAGNNTPGGDTTNPTKTCDRTGGPVAGAVDTHTISASTPGRTWPPNHKPSDITFTAKATKAVGTTNTAVDVSITGVDTTVMDVQGGAGDPNNVDAPAPAIANGMGEATAKQTYLVERSGKGTGRTYAFKVTAMFSDEPQACTTTFYVYIPHDQGNNAPKG
jgi:hypothetical protein